MVTEVKSLPTTERPEKGLKHGALGLISSTVVGVASTAPAYSLAATLGFVVAAIGLQAPVITIVAFIPMLFIAYAYKELNNADPDCGTTFTWGVRAFGPKTGWLGGWAIVAADVLVMASLAQVAGQYVFLLFNANGIGIDPSSGWVLLVGIAWIVVMTGICYVGIEVSANFQKVLLGIELTMLLILSCGRLGQGGERHGTARSPHPGVVLVQPVRRPLGLGLHQRRAPDAVHLLGMGHHGVGQRGDRRTRRPYPGRAAVLSTVILLAHLRARNPRGPELCRHRDQRASGSGTPTTRATCCRSSAHSVFGTQRVREPPGPPAVADGPELGGRVDPDHHPPHGPDHTGHGRLQGDPQRLLEGQHDASSPRRSPPWSWAWPPSCST